MTKSAGRYVFLLITEGYDDICIINVIYYHKKFYIAIDLDYIIRDINVNMNFLIINFMLCFIYNGLRHLTHVLLFIYYFY